MIRIWRAIFIGVALGAVLSACATGAPRELTRDEVLQQILPSAVQIVVEQREGRRVRTASGVVITSPTSLRRDCYILTAGHAVSGIAGEKEIYVTFGRYRGEAKRAQASVVVYRDNAELDLALLRVESDQCRPARPAGPAILGEPVWVIGFPWGRHMTLASGIVSQINADDGPDRETASQLMVDASVSYGTSGGGVYEARRGELIGVVKGYSTARVSAQGVDPPWYIDVPVPGQTYVTPLTDVKRFLADSGYADLIGQPGPRSGLLGTAVDRPR